jgi:hypothetical protein
MSLAASFFVQNGQFFLGILGELCYINTMKLTLPNITYEGRTYTNPVLHLKRDSANPAYLYSGTFTYDEFPYSPGEGGGGRILFCESTNLRRFLSNFKGCSS